MSNANRKPPTPKTRPVSAMLARTLPVIAPVFAFSLIINVLRLTVPLYMLQVIDRVLSSESTETLTFLTIIAAGALLTGGLLTAISGNVTSAMGAWVDEKLYPRLVARALQAPAHISTQASTSGLRDLGQLRRLVSGQTLTTLFEAPWTVVFIAVLYYLHPQLGLLAIAAAVTLLLVASFDETVAQSLRKEAQREKEIASKAIEQAVIAGESVKAMGFSERLAADLARENAETSARLDRATRRGSAVQTVSRTIRTAAQLSILCAGALLVLANEVTTGTMVAGAILLGLALSPVDKAIGTISALRSLSDIMARLNRQMDMDKPARPGAAVKPGEGGFRLALKQATYIPEGMRRPVLRPLNFEVEAGEVLGIIGPVGAGKTTLARLLTGVLQPSAGSVLLNDVSMAQMASPAMREHFGYLPQKGLALPGTITENICRFQQGDPAAISKAVTEVAKTAGVHGAILALPDGYETKLGALNEVALSPGQLQQILIARAFYGAPRLVVLDEPASWLDKSAEEGLIACIKSATARKATLVMVTQRPSLLNLCGRLLHIRDGHIVDIGSRSDVLERAASGAAGTGQPRRVRMQQGEGQQPQRRLPQGDGGQRRRGGEA